MIAMEHFWGRLGAQMGYFAWIRMFCLEHGLDFEHLPDFEPMLAKHGELIRSLYGAGIGPTDDRVSVHVRRTDYLRPEDPHVDLFAEGYYERAMARFPGRRFLVFSDDPAWCKQQPLFADCDFCEEPDAVRAMNLMAACSDNIIANSCFSWWAAWLNPNPHKRVIAPIHCEKRSGVKYGLSTWEAV